MVADTAHAFQASKSLEELVEHVRLWSAGTESEILTIFLAASATKNCGKKTVIKSAASAASTQGGCASSRLDHGCESGEAALAAD